MTCLQNVSYNLLITWLLLDSYFKKWWGQSSSQRWQGCQAWKSETNGYLWWATVSTFVRVTLVDIFKETLAQCLFFRREVGPSVGPIHGDQNRYFKPTLNLMKHGVLNCLWFLQKCTLPPFILVNGLQKPLSVPTRGTVCYMRARGA